MPRRIVLLLVVVIFFFTLMMALPNRQIPANAQIVTGDMMGEFLFDVDSLIFGLDPDGENRRELFEGTGQGYDTEASWSPDGWYVAFNTRGHPHEFGRSPDMMHIGNVRNQTLRPLTAIERFYLYAPPAWSPDGSRLAFVAADSSLVTEDMRPDRDLWVRDIWVINVDGTGLQRIRAHEAAEGQRRVLGPPAWSPNGTQIAFFEVPVDAENQQQGPVSVLMMNTDGSDVRHLFDVETLYNPRYGPMDRLAWSPDGTMLAFSADPATYTGMDGQPDLYVANLDGSDMRVVVNGSDNITQPVWSPDGQFIAYVTYRSEEQRGIFISNLAGTYERWVPNSRGAQFIDWTAGAVETQITGIETTKRNLTSVIDSDEYVLDNCGSPAQRTDSWRIEHQLTRSVSFLTGIETGVETNTCVGTNRTSSWNIGGELGPIKDILTISGGYESTTEQTSETCTAVSTALSSEFNLTEERTVTEERTFSVELPPNSIVKYEVTVNEVSVQGYVTVQRSNGFYEDEVQVPFVLRDRLRIDARPITASCDEG